MQDRGNSKGPVHMIVKLFQQLGIQSEDGRIWDSKGIKWDECHDADGIDAVAQELVHHVWRKLSKTRHHFQDSKRGEMINSRTKKQGSCNTP